MTGYIVVIGASAGGFSAIAQLVAGLDPRSNAAYLVVLHLAKTNSGEQLVARLQEKTTLKCVLAADDLPIENGHLYLAAPDHHLIVSGNRIRLGNGATENRWRPSIDMLFRTAAASFTTRVIGVVLTGLLNDGTTGLSAVKRSGGLAVVQDPQDAEYPDMPLSAIRNVNVDYIGRVDQLPGILQELTSVTPNDSIEPPADIVTEAQMALTLITNIPVSQQIGELTPYTCPDCGGVLFKHDQDSIVRFKCHTGHSYSLRDLSLKQAEELEASLWYALRVLEQKKHLYEALFEKYKESGPVHLAKDYAKSQNEIEAHIDILKGLLVSHRDIREPE